MALAKAVFCISGTLSKGRSAIEKDIKAHGGAVAGSITGKVTHLLCAPDEYASKASKVVMAGAKGVHIVKEEFVWDAIKAHKLPDVDSYLLSKEEGGGAPAKRAPPASGDDDAPAAKKAKGVAAVNPRSGLQDTAVVLVKGDYIFDAEMVQQDVAKNMDKFHDLQVLHKFDTDEYFFFQHWGRAGTSGQKNLDGPVAGGAGTPASGWPYQNFSKKFKEKSGFIFQPEGSSYIPAKANKYTVVQRMGTVDSKAKWEYYVDKPVDGKRPGWYPYDDTATENMERFYAQFHSNDCLAIRYVFSGTCTYKVDFQESQQTNVDHANHTTRPIRRLAP